MNWVIVGETIVILWFFLQWPLVFLGLYWWLFREWPFPKGYKWGKDLRLINNLRKAWFQSLASGDERRGAKQYYDEEDFYDIGQVSSDERSKVRHPKNADRAYSGGS